MWQLTEAQARARQIRLKAQFPDTDGRIMVRCISIEGLDPDNDGLNRATLRTRGLGLGARIYVNLGWPEREEWIACEVLPAHGWAHITHVRRIVDPVPR